MARHKGGRRYVDEWVITRLYLTADSSETLRKAFV